MFYDQDYDMKSDPRILEQLSKHDDAISQSSVPATPANQRPNLPNLDTSQIIKVNFDDGVSERSIARSVQNDMIPRPSGVLSTDLKQFSLTSTSMQARPVNHQRPMLDKLVEESDEGDAQAEYEAHVVANRPEGD